MFWNTGKLGTAEVVRDFVLIVGWIITVLVATNQLSAAQEENDRIKRAELKRSFQVEAYREVSTALVKFHGEISKVAGKYIVAAFVLSRPPIITYEQTVRSVYDGSESDGPELILALSRFAFLVETYQIPLLDIWHLYLYIQFRVKDAVELISGLRLRLVDETAARGPNVTTIVASESPRIHDALSNVMLFLGDFRTEANNMLVGEVFGQKVPRRRPRDTSIKTLVELATPEGVAAEQERRETEAIAKGLEVNSGQQQT